MALGSAAPVSAAPVISPFATDLPAINYSASSNYGISYYGSSAQSVFNGGYWNAGGRGSRWVQVDMGITQTLSEVKVKTAASYPGAISGGFVKVYLSNTPIGNSWTSLTAVAEVINPIGGGHLYDLTFAPTSGRYLQVVANFASSSWVALGDTLGRTDWTDPVSLSPVPEPESWAMMLAGLSVIVGVRTRRRTQAGRVQTSADT